MTLFTNDRIIGIYIFGYYKKTVSVGHSENFVSRFISWLLILSDFRIKCCVAGNHKNSDSHWASTGIK